MNTIYLDVETPNYNPATDGEKLGPKPGMGHFEFVGQSDSKQQNKFVWHLGTDK